MSFTELILLALLSLTFVDAYSFTFNQAPSQCSPLNVSITGSDGVAPFRLSLVPFGGSPLPIEVRRIQDLELPLDGFVLPYPKDSQFVAVMSDKNGSLASFGTGGVTTPVTVLGASDGSDTGCLPAAEVAPEFTIANDPLGDLTTCESVKLSWDSSKSTGNVTFWGIIPGGNTFLIPHSPASLLPTNQENQPAFSWTPNIPPGTTLMIVGGDEKGFGTGGSFDVVLRTGNTTTCGAQPVASSTALEGPSATPVGGTFATDPNGDVNTAAATSSASSSVGASHGASSAAGHLGPNNTIRLISIFVIVYVAVLLP